MRIDFLTQEKETVFAGKDLGIIPRIGETIKVYDESKGLSRRFMVLDVHYYLGGTANPEIVVIVA